jgi:hypothetical protein
MASKLPFAASADLHAMVDEMYAHLSYCAQRDRPTHNAVRDCDRRADPFIKVTAALDAELLSSHAAAHAHADTTPASDRQAAGFSTAIVTPQGASHGHISGTADVMVLSHDDSEVQISFDGDPFEDLAEAYVYGPVCTAVDGMTSNWYMLGKLARAAVKEGVLSEVAELLASVPEKRTALAKPNRTY